MWALIKLKLRLMRDNRSLYLIMIGMSLILSAVFSQSIGGDYQPSVYIYDGLQTTFSNDLINDLKSMDTFNIVLSDESNMEKAVSGREAVAGLVMTSDNRIELVTLNQTLESFELQSSVQSALSHEAVKHTIYESLLQIKPETDKQTINEAFDFKWVYQKPIQVIRQTIGVDDMDGYMTNVHFIIGMTLFFVTYSLMFTVGDILEDKRLRTLDRMMVAPVGRMTILVANLIPAFLIGCIQISIMIFAGQGLFGVNWGQHLGLVIITGIMYIFTMTCLCLWIVSMVKTMSQLGALSPIILTGMGMIGGCMWPLEIVNSKIILTLANLTPHRWAIAGIESAVMYGRVDLKPLIILGIMGIVFLGLGERLMAFNAKSA